MGWDAYAEPTRYSFRYKRKKWPYRQQFEAAAKRVQKAAGAVDGDLHHGGLDCSDCAYAIQEAVLSVSCWSDPWSPEKVKEYAARADWALPTQERWAVESAKEFLNTCAANGLGVLFTW